MRTLHRQFIILALILGFESGALLSLVLPLPIAIFFGFLAFAVSHDWGGKPLQRAPRLVNLLRAKAVARLFYLTFAFPLVRTLLLEIHEPEYLRRARECTFFTLPTSRVSGEPLSDSTVLALGRAYFAIASARDLSVVLFILMTLVLIAVPGMPNAGNVVIVAGVLFMMSGFYVVIGSLALRLLRNPKRSHCVFACVTAALMIISLPVYTPFGAYALMQLTRFRSGVEQDNKGPTLLR